MYNEIVVINIREYLRNKDDKEIGEEALQQILSDFSCAKNPDVERFLKKEAIAFAMKNQSVTYLVFTKDDATLVGYFTLATKAIHIEEAADISNTVKRKIARVSKLDETGNVYTLPAYLIAQLGKNFTNGANAKITGQQLLHAAVETIKELGGMVIFLEAENEEKLLKFYEEENGFKQFAVRETEGRASDVHTLIQLLKVL